MATPYFKRPYPRTQYHHKAEETLQLRVCRFLRTHYPDLVFRCDFASGLHLSPYQAKKHASMQSGRGFPDLTVYAPSKDGKFSALMLELKRDGTSVRYKRGERVGEVLADEHLQEQAKMHNDLRRRGFYADFSVGYKDTIEKINEYFGEIHKGQLDLF